MRQYCKEGVGVGVRVEVELFDELIDHKNIYTQDNLKKIRQRSFLDHIDLSCRS